MNREHARELLPILQAFVDRVPLERKHGLTWVNDEDEFHIDQQYRIKPEPKEFWTVIYNNGESMSAGKDRKEDVEAHINYIREDNPDWCPDAYIAKVREVIK